MSPTLSAQENGKLDGRLRSNISINTDTRSQTAAAQNAASLNSPKASTNKFKCVDMERYTCPALTMDGESTQELLGSVTTFTATGDHETAHPLRTSARVIHKMRMDSIRPPTPPPPSGTGALPKTPSQTRGLKNVWSNNEKNLFFEALNEHGRDFETIATTINTRMRRKAATDTDYKTKELVVRLYNQIFQKLLKYLHFSDEISKPAKELYALINYGEMRKKLMFINDKCYLKLSDLVYKGAVTIREKGKNIKIKTPSCRALRNLNELEEWQEEIKLPPRIDVVLRPANVAAWGKVQALAQNPRVKINLPLQKRVAGLLYTLNHKWRHRNIRLNEMIMKLQPVAGSSHSSKARIRHDAEFLNQLTRHHSRTVDLQPLCFTPPKDTIIHRPMINLSEFLSSYKICLNSYEDRIGATVRGESLSAEKVARIKEMLKSNSKRQRHDSDRVQPEKKSPDALSGHSSKRLKADEVVAPKTQELEVLAMEKAKNEAGTDGLLGVRALKMDEPGEAALLGLVKCKTVAPDSTDSESELNKLNVEDFRIFKQLTTTTSEEGSSSEVKMEDDSSVVTTCEATHNNNNKLICDSSNVISSSSTKPTKRKDLARNRKNKEFKPFISEEAIQKIREGWTLANVGDLTVGDLYVMFGNDLTLTLEYRWRDDRPKPSPDAPAVPAKPPAKNKTKKSLQRARLAMRRPEETVGDRLKQLLAIASLGEKLKKKPTCFCDHTCDKRLKGDADDLLVDGVFKQPAVPTRHFPTYFHDTYRLNPTYHNPSMRYRQASTARWFNNRSPRKGAKIMPLIKVVPPRIDPKKLPPPATATTSSAAAATSTTMSVSTSTETDGLNCFYEKAMAAEEQQEVVTQKDDVTKALEERIYRLKDRMTSTMSATTTTGGKSEVDDFDDASIKRLLYDSSSNLSYTAYDLSYPASPAMSPMRILREAPIIDSGTSADITDVSLNSFLGHLDAACDGNLKSMSRNCAQEQMSSNLSIISETSVDFIAKFEDIAAELRASENIS